MSNDNERSRQLLRDKVRSIPDFPSPGVLFRDITPILADADAMSVAVDLHVQQIADLGEQLDVVVGMESRGFLFGPILASRLGLAFVPARKPGKLPAETIEQAYDLEYGSTVLELHTDAFRRGARVLIVDDLLATGGTAAAASKLVERLGGEIMAFLFMIELEALGGRAVLGEARVESILRY